LKLRPIAVLVDREGLGDALLKIPMLRALERAFPGRRIWWIATHQTAMADDLRPWTSHLIERVIEYAGLTTPWYRVIPRLRQLPAFELVFDTRSRGFTVLLARTFLRHHGFFTCLPFYLFSSRRPPGLRQRPLGIGERVLTMAEAAAGGSVEWQGTFSVSMAAQQLAAERLPAGPRYVGLAPGSRETRKNWPRHSFITLARLLVEREVVPVFLIGPQERSLVSELREAVPAARIPEAHPPDPHLGIGQLEFGIAVCRRLAAAVANDSGIGHLLGSIGTPLVSLFGPTDASRWAPLTSHGITVRAQDFGSLTMETIPVDAVFAAVERLLAAGTDHV
jgi:ADP-heptose:LPS heptosyltransferase